MNKSKARKAIDVFVVVAEGFRRQQTKEIPEAKDLRTLCLIVR